MRVENTSGFSQVPASPVSPVAGPTTALPAASPAPASNLAAAPQDSFELAPSNQVALDSAVGATAQPAAQAASEPIQLDVPWYSQFEDGHGYTPGSSACFRAANAMAAEAGATVLSPKKINGENDYTGAAILVGTGEDSVGQLTIDSQKAVEGRNYINSELEAGRPVIVGVSHKGNAGANNGLTDHFVVVTGRNVDENGDAYYTFHDPGAGPLNAAKGKDTRVENRFYVDEQTGRMYRPGQSATGKVYDQRLEVDMVRLNAESAVNPAE